MHQLCLGICKRLLTKVIFSEKKKKNSGKDISSKKKQEKMEKKKKYLIQPIEQEFIVGELRKMKFPANYNHKIRSLDSLKAIDHLLIFGYCSAFFSWIPVVGPLFQQCGNIMRIVFKSEVSLQDLESLDNDVASFFNNYVNTFCSERVPPNFHLLHHMVRDTLLFGPGWTHNLFWFENFNHVMNLNISTTNNFDKRIISNFNSFQYIEKSIEEESIKNKKFLFLVRKLKKLKEKPQHGFWIQNSNLGWKREKFSCWVKLKSNEVGEISFEEASRKIFFFNQNGTSKEIKEDEIEAPLVQSFEISKENGSWKKKAIFLENLSIFDMF